MESESALSPDEMRWLVLIRYQVISAAEQSGQPSPLSALSLGWIHDAVEGFMSLVIQSKKLSTPKRPEFLQLFDSVATADTDGNLAGHRASIESLNNARVSWKHHGNIPSQATVGRHCSNGIDFLKAASIGVLNLDFDQVSLTDLVRSSQAQSEVRSAETDWIGSNASKAAEHLRLAFDEMVRDYEQRKVWSPGESLFSSKPTFMPSKHQYERNYGNPRLYEWLENLDNRLKILSFGIDLARYAYFEAHTPVVTYTAVGPRFYHRDGIELDDRSYQRCYRFVIDSAIRLYNEDFDFNHWDLTHPQTDEA